MKLVLPRGLAPRPFAFARRHARLLHLGSLETLASCRCCPGPSGLEDRHARCYINDVKWWLNSELRRTLLGFSEALICLSYSALKLVPPRGIAPRSTDYQSVALLLSYGGEKSPVKVTHPRLPDVSRARCYYANGREIVTASGLSPDRTELRTRLLEMLCICGGAETEMAEHQRIALWTVLRPQLFSGQFPRLCRTCSVKWLPE